MRLRDLKTPFEILDAAAQHAAVVAYREKRIAELTEAISKSAVEKKAKTIKTKKVSAPKVPEQVKNLAASLGISVTALLSMRTTDAPITEDEFSKE